MKFHADVALLRTLVDLATEAVHLKHRSVRYQIRRAVSGGIHVKQFDETVRDLTAVLTPLFVEQVRSMARRLGELGERSTVVEEKSAADGAAVLVKHIFDPAEWYDRLVDLALPVLAVKMAEAGVAYLLTLGIDRRKDFKKAITLPNGEIAWYECSGCGEKICTTSSLKPHCRACTKLTTASEWLAEHSEDVDKLGDVLRDSGVPIRVMTELPDWMKRSISKQLTDTFSQDYWRDIHKVTEGHAEEYLRQGLEEGWSIRRMSDTMATTFKGGTLKYAKMRATRIAITESGGALNGARRASMDQLAEELGPQVPMKPAWHSVLMDTTRDTHANLDGVPADEEGLFNVGGYRVPHPGHVSLPAGERVNCYCTLLTEFGMGEEESLRLIQEHEGRVQEMGEGGQ